MNTNLEILEAPLHRPTMPTELWSEILTGLWQGGTSDWDVMGASIGKKMSPVITPKQFDTVITLYAYARPVDWFVKEIRYGFWDSPDAEDFDPEPLFDLVQIAHRDWKRGKEVLIRCQAGLNRSGIIMALVLIRDGWKAEDAINLMRGERDSWVLCNKTFEKWLLTLDPADWQGDEYKM